MDERAGRWIAPAPWVDAMVRLAPEARTRAEQERTRRRWGRELAYSGSADDLLPSLTEAGLTRYVLTAPARRGDESRSLNYWLANTASAYAPAAAALGTVHPEDGAGLERLADEALRKLRLAGLHFDPVHGGFTLDDPRIRRVLARAEEERIPVVLDVGAEVGGGPAVGPRAVASLMRSLPRLRLLLSTVTGTPVAPLVEVVASFDELYLDAGVLLDGFLAAAPPLSMLLEVQDRLVFGSGFPLVPAPLPDLARAIEDLALGPAIEAKIFATNAARFFQWDLRALCPPDEIDGRAADPA